MFDFLERVAAFVFGTSLLGVIGLVGGVENGMPVINLLWCIPLIALMALTVCVMEF